MSCVALSAIAYIQFRSRTIPIIACYLQMGAFYSSSVVLNPIPLVLSKLFSASEIYLRYVVTLKRNFRYFCLQKESCQIIIILRLINILCDLITTQIQILGIFQLNAICFPHDRMFDGPVDVTKLLLTLKLELF